MHSWKIVIIPLKTDRDVKGVTMLPVSINVAGLFPPDISCCRAKIRLPPGNGYRSIVCPKESKAAENRRRTAQLRGALMRARGGQSHRSSAFASLSS